MWNKHLAGGTWPLAFAVGHQMQETAQAGLGTGLRPVLGGDSPAPTQLRFAG